MICTLTDFVCLDNSVLSIFLLFCLPDYNQNCKSNVNFNSAVYQYQQTSSPDLSDRKNPFLSNSRLGRPWLKFGKATVAKLK